MGQQSWVGALFGAATLLCCVLLIAADPLPVVLWHGMGDSCCNPLSMGRISKVIKKHKTGIFVHSIKIGKNIVSDTLAGFLKPVDEQIDEACAQIAAEPRLANGYNSIGFSQGSQFLRAVAQRCPTPRMNNLISIGGQHQGVYGIPNCNYDDVSLVSLCNALRKLVTTAAYTSMVQSTVVQAQYWHDPRDEETYREKSQFIADINQEREVNEAYKSNLQQLENFVMVRFNNDSMVHPTDSQWFGFYKSGSIRSTVSLQESNIYKQDKLGLAAMDEAGKLHFLEIDGDHLQMSDSWFVENIVKVYL